MENTAINTLSSIRTPDYHERSRLSCNPCEVCGREIKPGKGFMVATEQGDYPIGSTCVTKARKAGLVIR